MMGLRGVALVAYRLLGLWLGLSGLQALAETPITWKFLWAQNQPLFAGTTNPPTEAAFFLMTTSAVSARAIWGLLPWWAAPALARHTPIDQTRSDSRYPSRADLFSTAAFLVGVWLLSGAIPGLAYAAFAATRPGISPSDDGLGGARIAQLLAQTFLGIALVRGGWLVDLGMSGGAGLESVECNERERGVEHGDGADEQRQG